MIKMCDLPRYADVDMEEIRKMRDAHVVLNEVCLLYTSGGCD